MSFIFLVVVTLIFYNFITVLSYPCTLPHVFMNNKCYYFSDTAALSWEDAMKQCNAMQSKLVSIETEEENFHINAFLYRRYIAFPFYFWTSGSDQGHHGQWKWKTTGNNFTFQSWSKGFPENDKGNEHCLIISGPKKALEWNAAFCNTRQFLNVNTIGYICEKDVSSQDERPILTSPKLENYYCPPHFVATNGKCYYFSETSASSFEEAFYLCKILKAELLSIETSQENFMVDAYLTKKGRNMAYWTSGSDKNHEGLWKWKSTDKDFTFTKWGPKQPKNFHGAEHCIHLIHEKGNTIWSDAPCNLSFTYIVHYICERSMDIKADKCRNGMDEIPGITVLQSHTNFSPESKTPRGCPPNFVYMNSKCYFFGFNPSTWMEARNHCLSLNSNLLSIESQQESKELNEYIWKQKTRINYWTSGSDSEAEGKWKWTATQESLTYLNWCYGQPDNFKGQEHFLHLHHTEVDVCWNDVNGNVRSNEYDGKNMGFICESELVEVL